MIEDVDIFNIKEKLYVVPLKYKLCLSLTVCLESPKAFPSIEFIFLFTIVYYIMTFNNDSSFY